MTVSAAAREMGINKPAVEGSIGWLLKSGLGEKLEKGYGLSAFGLLVAKYDPEIKQEATLWLMHYYLVTEHHERAEVWFRAFQEFLTPNASFSRESLQRYVEQYTESSNIANVNDDCKQFIACYTRPCALGKLEIIQKVDKALFEVGLRNMPHQHVFAFTLFDIWQRIFPHTDTLRVTQITDSPQFPGKVFMARRDQIIQSLHILQSLGLVNVTESQHEPVTRRYRDDPFKLLEMHYSSI